MKHLKSFWLHYLLFIFMAIYIFVHINYFYHLVPLLIPNGFDTIPIIVVCFFALMVIMGWFVNSLILLSKEKKIYKSSIRNVWVWFSPKLFKLRYRSYRAITVMLSFIFVSLLFTLTIPTMLAILNGTEVNSHEVQRNQPPIETENAAPNSLKIDAALLDKNLNKDVIFGEGIIFVFIISVLGVWTFLNTEYLKARGEIEITDLDDMFSNIIRSLEEMTEKKMGSFFYYILDYSIATGHYSCTQGFLEYRKALRHFLCKHKVKFLGIVYETNKLKRKYGDHHKDQAELEKWLINSRDSMVNFLNKEDDDNSEFTRIIDDYKLVYKPIRLDNGYVDERYRPAYLHSSRHNYWLKWEDDPQTAQEIYNQSRQTVVTDLINNKSTIDDIMASIILETEEIGLTRLIISNAFVVQFVATEGEHINRPIGYYSEDRYMIEKYKTAFEDYFKEVLNGR